VPYGVYVAWIRRVRTASGATAVQIAESVGGRRRIVAHVGSAHTEAELGLLVERARALLDDPGQGKLDLGIDPVAPKASLIGPAGEPALFEGVACVARKPAMVAAPRVISASSQVLYDALAAVFTDLGFDAPGSGSSSAPARRKRRPTWSRTFAGTEMRSPTDKSSTLSLREPAATATTTQR